MKMTGSGIFVESLKRENVEVIFGYPGAKVITIYDELYGSDIKQILPHHEQGGVHAADGYARSTGKVGVCLTTSGPGATNLITGLATANMDSVPIVAFTGQVATSMIGTDAFQEADIKGITLPITKQNYIVEDVKDLARIIKEAFHISITGRPGPVLVDIPVDVLKSKTEFKYPDIVNVPGYKINYKGNKNQIKKAAKLINNTKRPVIYSGGGTIISGASYELRELANKASIPVTTTLMGIGVFDEGNKLSLGMLGMHGTKEANLAISKSDLIIALGARFDDRVTGKLDTFAPEAKIIHIDIDSAEIGKLVDVEVPIVGDVKEVLKELIPLIDRKKPGSWHEQIEEFRKNEDQSNIEKARLLKKGGKKSKLIPEQIIKKLNEITDGQALITTEVGQHQMWAAQYYRHKNPRSFITSGGLGTMGYGLPAAIGAQIGNPDATVVCLAGDGSIQMNIQEFATIAKNKLPLNIIIFNNQYLGMVRQWQELFYDKRYAGTCMRRQEGCPAKCSSPGPDCPEIIPDFVTVAAGYGIKGKRITDANDIEPVLKEAINSNKPYIIDFIIEEEENVFPMVRGGASLEEMILREDIEK